jgi:DNA-directed RNA polymerase subunit H (RpoH/RPB5)
MSKSDSSSSTSSNTSTMEVFTIEKSNEEKRDTVLTNIIKMLRERNYIADNKTANETIKNMIKPNNLEHDDSKYTIKINNYEGNKEIKSLIIKIIPYKITSVSKTYGISDFLNAERDIPKILVVDEVSKRAMSIIKTYKNVEVFEEEFLMINWQEHVLVPKHEKLSKQEKQAVLDEYLLKKIQMPRMLSTEPGSIYYNAKLGDVFRIIRPSTRSGITRAYRLVVPAPAK